jgi:hypothetical protein
MIRPPRVAEAVLESLGAQPEFRDDVLGDLAEELAIRAGWDGERAARRWYYREAIRVAPALLRNWAGTLRVRDVARLLGVALTSHVFVGVITLIFLAVARTTAGPENVFSALRWLARREALPFAVNLAFGSLVGIGTGYLAGWLHRPAPVVAGLALGALWSVLGLMVFGVLTDAPAWYVFAMPFVTIAATTTGGALRASVARRESVAVPTADSRAAR